MWNRIKTYYSGDARCPAEFASGPCGFGGGTKSVRETTIALMKRYRNEIGYSVPITEDDLL